MAFFSFAENRPPQRHFPRAVSFDQRFAADNAANTLLGKDSTVFLVSVVKSGTMYAE